MEKNLLKDIVFELLPESEPLPHKLLLDADPSLSIVESYINDSTVYVAWLKKEIIATIVLYPVGLDSLEIKNIAVHERWQGKGIGKLLLRNATQIAIEKKMKVMIIGTSNASIGQLYLYQKNGFEISELKYNFFLENYPEPIFENGIQCKHMIMLTKKLV